MKCEVTLDDDGGVVAPDGDAAWSDTDKTTGYVLSNSNFTASQTNTGGGVRSATSHTTGKWYVEFTVNTMTGNIFRNDGIGLCIASTPLTGLYSHPTNLFIRSTDGHVYNGNNAELAALGSLQGQVIGIAYDGDAGKTWVRSSTTGNFWKGNGVGSAGDPVTGTTGFPSPFGGDPVFLFMGGDGGTTDIVTINDVLVYTPPAGFDPW